MSHAGATFWYVLPSLPMFLLVPMLMRGGVHFWSALSAGCALAALLSTVMTMTAARLGVMP